MKRWIRWAAWLYPAEWRTRYGAEFDVFLNDAPLRWRDFGDVIRGAAIMQMTSWMTYWKVALLAGVAGAILAGMIAFSIHDQWVCTAALAIEKPGATQGQVQRALMDANLKILGRDGLIALIRDPELGLYKKELRSLTVEQIAEDRFRKHIHVIPYGSIEPGAQAFEIVFSYPDRYQAKAVVERLTKAFQEQLSTAPDGLTLSILENPILPQRPTSPVRLAYVIFGLITGMLTGVLSLGVWRRTRTYAVVTVDLPRDTKQFVDRQIAAGQFRSVSEYVRELIRADEQRRR
jgi:hypothetical protein